MSECDCGAPLSDSLHREYVSGGQSSGSTCALNVRDNDVWVLGDALVVNDKRPQLNRVIRLRPVPPAAMRLYTWHTMNNTQIHVWHVGMRVPWGQ